ncbi:response regulator [Sphingosinicella sp. BN140058]|uniref:response regulator n=1 Tax=Sphingosinicella sp. BN140058 TaxID=1892855 RepID=UPI0013EDACD9|nr:response regulator [Sphingosinicella sp. BN140058]
MRRSVSLLILAGLLPVIALGGTFGAITLANEEAALKRQAQTDARFAAALLSVKLQSNLRAVEMVAQSPALDGVPDLQRFRILAARIVANQPDWRTVSLADPAGNRIADVPIAIGGKQTGKVVEMTSLRRVVASGRPTIGNVVAGPGGVRAFAIRAPVLKGGRVRFVVTAVVPATRLRDLLLFEDLPDGWTASVIDASNSPVTASGQLAAQGGRADLLERSAPVAGTDWTVRITAPARIFSAPVERAVLLLILAALLCLGVVLLLARMLAADLKEGRQRDAALLQSQRMEALGRLTGGVAHDFNNLLTPILGGLDMIRRRTTDERSARYADAALASAERARSLVGRLLAFSRRQNLAPRSLDLRMLIENMSDLIARSLTPVIEVRVEAEGPARPALADPGQLELAILNLVINARDAMPCGGTLRIATGSASPEMIDGLPPGDYVYVAVEDAGSGMDEATLKHAVDPFFTTKAVDKGTGLGLSMIDGFAAQSGGALRLRSEVGTGTTATIVLPCSREAPVVSQSPVAMPTRLSSGRILLVDDDDGVRTATAEMLRDADQDIVEAANVDQALQRLREDGRFDAVVTDFVMPGKSGGDLIRQLRADHPQLPVLLVTGFVTATEGLPDDVAVLRKPFSNAELLAAIARLQQTEAAGPPSP